MNRISITLVLVAALLGASLAARPAHAWGERAQQTIAALASQVSKDSYKHVFRPGEQSFERDVLRGAIAGPKELLQFTPMNSDAEAIQAVSSEIQLLRNVQKYGTTSYLAFRLGVLSSLVSNLIMPFGFAWTAEEREIQAKVVQDIENNLTSYSFMRSTNPRMMIRDSQEYFRQHRAFYEGDKRLIMDDYARGKGFNGFMREGGQAYFSRSVEAVSDAWHTVLSNGSAPLINSVSTRQLTWYFVKEIEYLLNVKDNFHQALKGYEHLTRVGSDVTEAFETVGDLFYDYGRARNHEDATLRGVREWQRAYDMGGPTRNRISQKLSNHYLTEGQFYLARAATKEAKDTDLPVALKAFEDALQYNRTSQQAANLIERTHVAISERRARLQTAVALNAQADQVMEAAERSRLAGDYSNALGQFAQAINVFSAVDDEFPDQFSAAETGVREASRNITRVVEEVLDRASDSIEQGDRAQEQNRYDEAIAAYQRVEDILGVIPADSRPNHLKSKEDHLKMAANKIDEARINKQRYETAQSQAAAGG